MADNFDILLFVGNGKHSKTYEVVHKQTKTKYFMEMVKKHAHTTSGELRTHETEQSHLMQIFYSFHSKKRSCYVLTHVSEKLSLKHVLLNGEAWRFVALELVCALQHLLENNAFYGDLSLEDIYCDSSGHVVLKRSVSSRACWSQSECVNCHAGACHLKYHNGSKLSQKHVNLQFNILSKFLSKHVDSIGEDFTDFIAQLTRKHVDVEQLKKHALVRNVSWKAVIDKQLPVPDQIKEIITHKEEKAEEKPKNTLKLIGGRRKSRDHTSTLQKHTETIQRRNREAVDKLLGRLRHLSTRERTRRPLVRRYKSEIKQKSSYSPREENNLRKSMSATHGCYISKTLPITPSKRSRQDIMRSVSKLSSDSGYHTCNARSSKRKSSYRSSVNDQESMRRWMPLTHAAHVKNASSQNTSKICSDCNTEHVGGLCDVCAKMRTKRSKAIIELIQTETNYGNDLKTLKEEFMIPLKNSEICTPDEIQLIFVNVQELIEVNSKLCYHLQRCLEECVKIGDYDCIYLQMGEVFLENREIFEAFERYCSKQIDSAKLLNTVLQRSNVLSVFLDVLSRDNEKLRKLDLKTFLTIPVQRLTKYPLLLSTIRKYTAASNPDGIELDVAVKQVNAKIEEINCSIIQMNKTALKKTSSSVSTELFDDNATLLRVVSNIKQWKTETTHVAQQDFFETTMQDVYHAKFFSNTGSKRYVEIMLCVNGDIKRDGKKETYENVKGGMLVLLKTKSNKKSILNVWYDLANCIVCTSRDLPNVIQVIEMNKQPLTLIAANQRLYNQWKTTLDDVIRSLNPKWRQRRNALVNIMMLNE